MKKTEEKPAKAPDLGAFTTPIDSLMANLEKTKKLNFKELSEELNLDVDSVEKVVLMLEKNGLVNVHYPELITSNPWVSLEKTLEKETREKVVGEKLEEYNFEVDSVAAKVTIVKKPNEQRPVYFIESPFLQPYAKAFLDELKEDILDKIPIDAGEITDTKKSRELKKKFFDITNAELKKYFQKVPEEKLNVITGLMMHSMYGLGKIELLMSDNFLEEITINSSRNPVMIYHLKHGWLKTNIYLDSEEEIYTYASQIARKVGREITTLNPILDAHLSTGDRVNATLAPITSFGNTITIRRFARRPWTITDFIGKSHTMNIQMASLIWLAMQYEMNIIIAGGTASGKTSTLNVLSAFMPSYHRIISIEDVRELMLPRYLHDNWVPMTTRNPNPEGQGEVTMLELMQSSLRMRPDRIILGEIRRHREAEVLFEAMHTGHSVYSTLHANSSQQVLERLIQPPISIPALEVSAIDLVLVQYRDRKLNVRRTLELAEIESGVSDNSLDINTIFKWSPRDDSWESMNPATKFVRNLNLHTGMTESEIGIELENRASILQWMLDNEITEINEVGKVMNMFYSNPDLLKKTAKKNESPKNILEG